MADQTLYERTVALEPLTRDDWKQLLLELRDDDPATRETRYMVYQMRLNFDMVWSIDRLDHFSTKLSKRLIWLTWVLAVLTAVLVIEPLISLLVGAH